MPLTLHKTTTFPGAPLADALYFVEDGNDNFELILTDSAAVGHILFSNRLVLKGFTRDATDNNLLFDGVDVESHYPGVEW